MACMKHKHKNEKNKDIVMDSITGSLPQQNRKRIEKEPFMISTISGLKYIVFSSHN